MRHSRLDMTGADTQVSQNLVCAKALCLLDGICSIDKLRDGMALTPLAKWGET